MYVPVRDGSLTSTFAHRGSFVTVYLDATRAPDGTADVIDARWEKVIATLGDADVDSVDAIGEALIAAPGDTAPHGLVAVAAEGELCLTRRMPHPPATSEGFHAPLPNLLPYLAATLPEVPNLVVVADPAEPRVLQASGAELRQLWSPPARGGVVDSLLARAVAHLASQENPDLVVVAGSREGQLRTISGIARSLVEGVTVRTVTVDSSDPAALHSAVERTLRTYFEGPRSTLLSTLRGAGGERGGGRAVAGLRDVIGALRMAQVDTVVLDDGPTMSRACWVGARPTEFGIRDVDAQAAGVSRIGRDRIGAALVRAIVATGARLVIATKDEIGHPDAVAALLR